MLASGRGDGDAREPEGAQNRPLARVGILNADEGDDVALAPDDPLGDVEVVIVKLIAPASIADRRQHNEEHHEQHRSNDREHSNKGERPRRRFDGGANGEGGSAAEVAEHDPDDVVYPPHVLHPRIELALRGSVHKESLSRARPRRERFPHDNKCRQTFRKAKGKALRRQGVMLPSNLLTASMAFVAFLQKVAWANQIVYDGKAESIAQQKRRES